MACRPMDLPWGEDVFVFFPELVPLVWFSGRLATIAW